MKLLVQGMRKNSIQLEVNPPGGMKRNLPQCSMSVYYKMKKAYQCSLKCGTLGGRCGYIVERELSTMSTHPLDKESIQ